MTEQARTMDVEALYREALGAAREAFQAVQREHTDETFYGFAFGTDPEGLSFYAMANTEEGLTRAAEAYASKGSGDDIGLQRTVLRWSQWDWAYVFDERDSRFLEVHRILRESEAILLGDEEDEDNFQALDQVYDTYIKVLRQLDSEGIFGFGAKRLEIAVVMTTSDCSDEETLAWTSQINPESVSKRVETELNARIGAFNTLSKHDD